MGKRTILGSLFSAIFLAALLFFVLFFFVPSISDAFFHVSYQGMKDTKQLKESVETVLERARVPKIAIDEYIAKLDDSALYKNIKESASKGNDVLYSYLESVGEGIDFGELKAQELKETLKKGFEDTSKYTLRQVEALKRIFSNSLDVN
ncbi:MAG: hypothetical protein EOM67_07085 [Spirochaetia bacterium]|nr:hypothetical protein [Spirochaetia bacterium]